MRVVVKGAPEDLKRDLRGDSVSVELADGRREDAHAAVSELDSVLEAALDGRVLRARVAHGGQAVPGILSALESRDIPVASVTLARPSLDDVYLHYTGHDFRSDDEAGTHG